LPKEKSPPVPSRVDRLDPRVSHFATLAQTLDRIVPFSLLLRRTIAFATHIRSTFLCRQYLP
jgi:hypothetical protein